MMACNGFPEQVHKPCVRKWAEQSTNCSEAAVGGCWVMGLLVICSSF